MNQQCKVCGEPAAGFHFGAFTCEGCKSFFGRTYNNLSSISECKNSGECVINKKNRTACKACRLRKCLLVGMSKSGSRYGRRSNWFKIHCLLQEQQQKGYNTNQNVPTSPTIMSTNFLPSQFFQNYCNTKLMKTSDEKQRQACGSPSDSGASSADLDENYMKTSSPIKNRDSNSMMSYKNYPHAKLDVITSISPRPSSAGSYAGVLCSTPNNNESFKLIQHSALFQFAATASPAVAAAAAAAAAAVGIIQDEPIDLSIKSKVVKTTSLTSSPRAGSDDNDVRNGNNVNGVDDDDDDEDGDIDVVETTTTTTIKPFPLDLTLIRPKTLSG